MRVIGTAGHVDHGKSTLVSALTGINPDRLKEEQQREMTIELGFAWMTLPGGEEVGIVDVPGHRDFIENMLSGVGGIDAVIFVVAADEGVMPQTREHLAILDILKIPGGVIALTKTDLADDPDWLALVEEDLAKVLQGTVLEGAPVVRVSARKGNGLAALVDAIEKSLLKTPVRPDNGRPRLPIDRVFTIAGFGTVVTGTLIDGELRTGDEVELLPGGPRGRVRGLQAHKRKEDTAQPGSRTAVNISGVDVNEIQRGYVLARPGDYRPTRRLDVHFQLLKDASVHIQHNMDVKVFLGAAETAARLRLLGSDDLAPGQSGWLQLELEQPLVAVHGDRYILRRPSPGETLGGGEVVDPFPKRRHKRFAAEVLSRLEKLQQGTPEELVNQALLQSGPVSAKDLIEQVRLSEEDFEAALEHLKHTGQVISLTPEAAQHNEIILTARTLEQESKRVQELLSQYHQKLPLRLGIPREELKSRLKHPARIYSAFISYWVENKLLVESNGLVKLPNHDIRFNADQQKRIAELDRQFGQAPYSPPTVKDSQQMVGEEVYEALLSVGRYIQLSTDVVFRKTDFDHLTTDVKGWLKKQPSITVAEFRDRYQTSRRYALAYLEYLDQTGVTIREGDARRAKQPV